MSGVVARRGRRFPRRVVGVDVLRARGIGLGPGNETGPAEPSTRSELGRRVSEHHAAKEMGNAEIRVPDGSFAGRREARFIAPRIRRGC